ncbi:GDP-mannose 4,6-dehydratase [Hyphomonas oceanitis]|uniref:Putative GDP-6-deoxy-D-lyxo-4-hexulose reductase n=1 Tax=Hyphomonas oceanitis SCH89 TaxID=1280953 RepID=A0A059G1G9_9PROT|nr:GDP-mannose 4,6-dehydratase [Hyphomonas oceanitis]KCZ99524.1 putative GDP-6-deoxy-D-lyxo-4-hexulose reductase [Hyphomonas oceanitis SCH89]
MAFGSQDKILVTGAAGFVGRFCIDALLASGLSADQIYALSRRGETVAASNVRTAVGDVTDRRAVRSLLADVQPSAVIHLAAVAEPAKARANHDAAWTTNFESARYLGESILDVAPDTRLIFSGSSEAYGASFNDEHLPILESVALRPMSTYGATKAAADLLLGQMATDGLKVVRFRAFNHTGPGQSPAYVVAAFAEQIARIEAGAQPPVIQVGNLEAERDFLDVRDVVRAYVLACHQPLDWGGNNVFNIASGTPRSIQSIVDSLRACSDHQISIETDAKRLRPNDVQRAFGDISRIGSVLGWQQQIGFDVTLRDTLAQARVTASFDAGSNTEKPE